MRAVAKWLVARPLNGVLVLAATSSPYLGFLSAALVVLLVLHDGARVATFKAAGAAVLLGLIGAVVGTPPSVVLAWLRRRRARSSEGVKAKISFTTRFI